MRLAHAIGALPPQVSQQLLEKTGVVPEPVASAGESNQTEQRAFDQGAEQAQQEQAQYQAEQGSIDRQLQLEAMQRANDEHEQSQLVFLHRAKMNSLARTGDWKSDLE